MKEVYLYKKLDNKKVQCQVCNHTCLILPDKTGICGVRQNQGGKLFALNYRKAISCNIDPIEKKPFFHFLPGSSSMSMATVGCNLRCDFCQNWNISQISKGDGPIMGQDVSPEKIIKDALEYDCKSIAYTYTEPTIFLEYALDTMKLAQKEGLKNLWITNGYMSKKTLKLISPYLDAVNVDLKSFREDFYNKICGAKLKPVLKNLVEMKKLGIWIEVTTLLIPEKNDGDKELKEIARFIAKELGKETPWHISRFFPTYKMRNIPPTPPETIHKAYKIGKKVGLKYVYSGNIPGNKYESTFCPKCGKKIITRLRFSVEEMKLDKNKCKFCGEKIDIIIE